MGRKKVNEDVKLSNLVKVQLDDYDMQNIWDTCSFTGFTRSKTIRLMCRYVGSHMYDFINWLEGQKLI